MSQSISEMISRLRDLKEEARRISHELTSEVTKDKSIMAALESGLIRLNFPTPPGFYRHFNIKNRTR